MKALLPTRRRDASPRPFRLVPLCIVPTARALLGGAQIAAVVEAGLLADSVATIKPQKSRRRARGLRRAGAAARAVTAALRDARLAPKASVGTETVVGLLGFNRPAAADTLDLGLNDPATRAEAAYSLALPRRRWSVHSSGNGTTLKRVSPRWLMPRRYAV